MGGILNKKFLLNGCGQLTIKMQDLSPDNIDLESRISAPTAEVYADAV
jgi:hypothetical protein